MCWETRIDIVRRPVFGDGVFNCLLYRSCDFVHVCFDLFLRLYVLWGPYSIVLCDVLLQCVVKSFPVGFVEVVSVSGLFKFVLVMSVSEIADEGEVV